MMDRPVEWKADKPDYIRNIKNGERRFLAPVDMRANEDGTVEGVASVVNQWYDMTFYDEMIAPGAFDEVMNDDVRALFNHDPSLVLGRTKSKTLELFNDGNGNLSYRYKTPNRTYAKDLEDMIRSGDVSQSSFAFTIKDEEWQWAKKSTERDKRIIRKVEKLYDVSPVTYPANPGTNVTIARAIIDKHNEEMRAAKEAEDTINNNLKLELDLKLKLKGL